MMDLSIRRASCLQWKGFCKENRQGRHRWPFLALVGLEEACTLSHSRRTSVRVFEIFYAD
jgi:hypothetical protein